MKRIIVLAMTVLFACGGSSTPAPAVPVQDPGPQFPLLPGADAGSPVRISGISNLCDKMAEGRVMPMTGLAYTGQRLRWKGTVEKLEGQRLIVGVGRLTVIAILPPLVDTSFAPGEIVEVAGVIASLDIQNRVVVLGDEATANPPQH